MQGFSRKPLHLFSEKYGGKDRDGNVKKYNALPRFLNLYSGNARKEVHLQEIPIHPDSLTMKNFFYIFLSFLFSYSTLLSAKALVFPSLSSVFVPVSQHQDGEDTDTEIDVPSRKNASAFGIDVSHYQGVIDWERVKTSGQHPVEFAYIKASQGITIQDDCYQRNITEARRAGILVGSYHYFSSGGTGIEQCDYFMETIKDFPQDLVPVVDVEECPRSWGPMALCRNLRDFLLRMEQVYGIRPIIYSGIFFYNNYLAHEFRDYTLFIARYADEAPITADGADWVIWQFSERGRIDGIRHKVDLDCINGNYSLDDILLHKPYRYPRSGKKGKPHVHPNQLPPDAGLMP